MRLRLAVVPLGFIFSVAQLGAIPVPALDIRALTAAADLIVTGSVISATDRGPLSASLNEPQGRPVVVVLSVDQIAKGEQKSLDIRVNFLVSDEPAGFPSVLAGQYGLFFLKARSGADDYDFVSSYYPFLPATPGSQLTATAPFDRVLQGLVAAVERGMPTDVRRAAIHALWAVDSPISRAGLRPLLDEADQEIRLGAAAALIRLDDVDALRLVTPLLSTGALLVDPDLAHNLRVAVMEGMRTPAAVPTLSELMRSPMVETRRAASWALSQARSPLALEPLAYGLEDADLEVRYNVVSGLAKATGDRQAQVSRDVFDANPERYVDYWREWRMRQSSPSVPQR